MGLPSGNRWAISNLDSTGPYYLQESPFQYGCSFFSWGNMTPHNTVSETEFDYDFGGTNPEAPYYEGQPYGDTPGSALTGNIPLSMDAVRRLLGNPWRIPTSADYEELFAGIIYINADGTEIGTDQANKLVNVNGVMGIYIQSVFNGARLFFPCSGYGGGNLLYDRGASGVFWTSDWESDRNAKSMVFNISGVYQQTPNGRSLGSVLRPVWNPRDLRG